MKKMSKTIVFFGNEKLATGLPVAKPIIRDALKSAGFEIEQIVTGKLSQLQPHSAKLAVLAAYGRIVPQSVLDEFPLGIINVHPSLLPLHRGPTPIEQAMLDGATKTGVSIMQLTSGMDEGPIYKQKTVHLSGEESKAELTEYLQQIGSELLLDVLPEIINGTLKPHKQPHPNRATYSRKLTKADGVIDWKKPAAQIEREIRAYLGWPSSRTTLAGKDVIITQAHVAGYEFHAPGGDVVGKSFQTPDNLVGVACGEGVLVIDQLKPAGKPEMTAQAFLAGYKQLLDL